MITSHINPAQIYAGEPCQVWFNSTRTGTGYIGIYIDNVLKHTLTAPIVAGRCSAEIGSIIEQYATGPIISLRNNNGLTRSIALPIVLDTIATIRVVASDYTSINSPTAVDLFSVPLIRGTRDAIGSMFQYIGTPKLLRGAWAMGNIVPAGISCTLRARSIREGGYTDIVQGLNIDPLSRTVFAVQLREDEYWREAHTLELSAVLANGSVYQSVSIPLRKKQYADKQAYFRNSAGAFQPAILRSVSEDVQIKYSAIKPAFSDTRKLTTGGALRAVQYSGATKHILSCNSGYYDNSTSNHIEELLQSDEIYVDDSNYLRRMLIAEKLTAPIQSMQARVLSSSIKLIDYRSNNIINRRYYYDYY